jgi:hypothetical protein
LTEPWRQNRYQYVVDALLGKVADGVTGRAVPARGVPWFMYAPEKVPPVRTIARTSLTVPTTSRIVELGLVSMKVDAGWEKRKEVARGGGGGAA